MKFINRHILDNQNIPDGWVLEFIAERLTLILAMLD